MRFYIVLILFLWWIEWRTDFTWKFLQKLESESHAIKFRSFFSMSWLETTVRINHYYIFSSHPVICGRSRFYQMHIGGLQLSIRLEDARCHVGMLESINHVATLKTKLATSGLLTSRIIIMLYFWKTLSDIKKTLFWKLLSFLWLDLQWVIKGFKNTLLLSYLSKNSEIFR